MHIRELSPQVSNYAAKHGGMKSLLSECGILMATWYYWAGEQKAPADSPPGLFTLAEKVTGSRPPHITIKGRVYPDPRAEDLAAIGLLKNELAAQATLMRQLQTECEFLRTNEARRKAALAGRCG